MPVICRGSQGKGWGNMLASDLRLGRTGSADIGDVVGTMPEIGANVITPGTTNQIIAANQYLTGAQTILGDPDLIASNIINTANIFGIQGIVVPHRLIAGDTYTLKEFVGILTTSDTNHHFHNMTITTKINGSIRISFTLFADVYSYGYGQIYKNGVAVGMSRMVYQVSETFVEDFNCAEGDVFQLDYQKSGVNNASVTSFKVMATIQNFVI